jgi:hypothetical protein
LRHFGRREIIYRRRRRRHYRDKEEGAAWSGFIDRRRVSRAEYRETVETEGSGWVTWREVSAPYSTKITRNQTGFWLDEVEWRRFRLGGEGEGEGEGEGGFLEGAESGSGQVTEIVAALFWWRGIILRNNVNKLERKNSYWRWGDCIFIVKFQWF